MTRLTIIIALLLPAFAAAKTVAAPKAAVPVIRLPAAYENLADTAGATPAALDRWWLAFDDRAEYFEEGCRDLFVVKLKTVEEGASTQDTWSTLINGVQTRAFAAADTPIHLTHMAERITRFRDRALLDGNLHEAPENRRSPRP